MKKKFLLGVVMIAAALPVSLIADVLRVPLQYSSIQSAINSSSSYDTILVSSGTYYENLNFLGKAIVVKGDGAAETVVINGSRPVDADSGSVFIFASGETSTSVLDGVTVTGGTGTMTDLGEKRGGGILCINAKPVIKNCIIRDNRSPTGGGIAVWRGQAQYMDSTLVERCIVTNQLGNKRVWRWRVGWIWNNSNPQLYPRWKHSSGRRREFRRFIVPERIVPSPIQLFGLARFMTLRSKEISTTVTSREVGHRVRVTSAPTHISAM